MGIHHLNSMNPQPKHAGESFPTLFPLLPSLPSAQESRDPVSSGGNASSNFGVPGRGDNAWEPKSQHEDHSRASVGLIKNIPTTFTCPTSAFVGGKSPTTRRDSEPRTAGSHATSKTKTTGRKGDPRMHRAVAARLADPTLTLFQALVMGGFDYTVDDYTDSSCTDSENVTLAQRKNQLSRRLRLARRQHITPNAVKCKAIAVEKGVSEGDQAVTALIKLGGSRQVTDTRAGTTAAASTVAVSPDSSAVGGQGRHIEESPNSGLARMLRLQRESFRMLQQQQLLEDSGGGSAK